MWVDIGTSCNQITADLQLSIVMHMTIARQRPCKHSLGVTLSTIEGHPLLGNGPLNTRSRTTEGECFPSSPCRGIVGGHKEISEAGSSRSTREYSGEREREWRRS
jgi:hypothetical protein